ncbi:unnamed protein product [Effrenium voratum]|nr:unnamed protein product [Effrenium voratum]
MGTSGSCCSCEDDLQGGADDSKRPGRQTRKRSSTEFTIIIDRRNGEGLGIDAAPEKVGTLEIKSVTPGGLVDRWNQAQQPGSKEIVRPGMRVVEVNGRFNSAVGLIAACREAEAGASAERADPTRRSDRTGALDQTIDTLKCLVGKLRLVLLCLVLLGAEGLRKHHKRHVRHHAPKPQAALLSSSVEEQLAEQLVREAEASANLEDPPKEAKAEVKPKAEVKAKQTVPENKTKVPKDTKKEVNGDNSTEEEDKSDEDILDEADDVPDLDKNQTEDVKSGCQALPLVGALGLAFFNF